MTSLSVAQRPVRALASHQCSPVSIPGVDSACGLSLLLVLIPALRVFLRVLWSSSLHKNQQFQIPTWPGTHGHFLIEFLSGELFGSPWINKLRFTRVYVLSCLRNMMA